MDNVKKSMIKMNLSRKMLIIKTQDIFVTFSINIEKD